MPNEHQSASLRVTYDPEADAAYIYLTGTIDAGGVDRTITATESINLDIDHEGRLVGIELLSGSLLHPHLRAIATRPVGQSLRSEAE